MAKDPAVLFYTGDFLNGCSCLTMEERGQYITLLCLQHQLGHLSEKTIRLSLGSVSVDVMNKFKTDEQGSYYNERMDEEIEKRLQFIETRRDNGSKGGRPRKANAKPNGKPNAKANEKLIENENINEDNVLKVQFENFRKTFPGTKRGLDVEFENFIKKHSEWKEIVPILKDRLLYQISARETKRLAKEFVPEWKNLQTWINQSCWEEEIPVSTNGKIESPIEFNNVINRETIVR